MPNTFVAIFTGGAEPAAHTILDADAAADVCRVAGTGIGLITVRDDLAGVDFVIPARAVTHIRMREDT